jgi:hypothetical protein
MSDPAEDTVEPDGIESILGLPDAEVRKVYNLIVKATSDGMAQGAAKIQAQVQAQHGTWIKVREVAIVATPVLLLTILAVLLLKE